MASADLNVYRTIAKSFELLANHRRILSIKSTKSSENAQDKLLSVDRDEQERIHIDNEETATIQTASPDMLQIEDNAPPIGPRQISFTNYKDRERHTNNRNNSYNTNENTTQKKEEKEDEEELDSDDDFGAIMTMSRMKSDHFDSLQKATLKRQRSEEVVVGKMKYIYDVDANDNRTFNRRKSLSKFTGTGYSLRDQ
eukprot:572291_1